MIVLNPTDSTPLYEQITEKLKELIIGGYLKENDKIPSVRELASQLAINPNTIQKAYKQLEFEGYIYARPAKGYFVKIPDNCDGKTPVLVEQLTGIVKELYFLGCSKEKIDKIITEIYKQGGGQND